MLLRQWRIWIDTIRRIFRSLSTLEEKMGQVSDALAGVKDQLAKAKGEILGRIADLEAQVAASGLDPADLAAIEDLKGAAQSLDDVVADVVPEPEPEPQSEPAPEPSPEPTEPA